MATATLACKQCNFENEPERVYCHNCGAKLDRSLLPPEATRREDPTIVQNRVRKMVSPRRGMGLQQVKNFFASLITACVLAVLLLIIKPPAIVPEVSKEALMSAPTITDDLENLAAQPSRSLRYTEDAVNAFLQYSVRGKEAAKFGVTMKFDRIYVQLKEGSCSLTSKRTVVVLPIYATTVRTVEVKNGAVVSRVTGGSLGSLRLPVALMPIVESGFTPIWEKLGKDKELIARLQSINFHDKSVEMISKPAGAR